MNKVLTILLLLFALSGTAQNAWKDEWIKQDKALHFSCSASLSMMGMEIAKDLRLKDPELIGISFSLAVGIGKEFIYDSRPSPYDIAANITGAVAGIYINRWLNN
jgi:uncharacterized protein YfiM (DUF2279 family)